MEDKLNFIIGQLTNINNRLDMVENRINNTPISDTTESSSYPGYQQTRKNNIDECIDMMNWEKIHKVMKFLNWEWINVGPRGEMGVPSVEQLISHTKNDLIRCFESMDKYNEESDGESSEYSIYSGGIKVKTWPDNNCEVYFILSDANTFE